jgi:5-hydroxyisourate hydrolase-like protein (transthyretin family)
MRTLFKIIILGCAITNVMAGTYPAKDDAHAQFCLEIFGLAMEHGKPIDGVSVKLYKENEELEWTEITSVVYHEHSFNFRLDANSYYTIEISKPGYVSRSVAVNTKIPNYIALETKFRYEFEVELFRTQQTFDEYYLDFPVALIRYDDKRDIFLNSAGYTKHIKSLMQGQAGKNKLYTQQ